MDIKLKIVTDFIKEMIRDKQTILDRNESDGLKNFAMKYSKAELETLLILIQQVSDRDE